MEFHGLGVTEHSQGSKTVMSLCNLAMLTGNIGRPGVGINPLRGQNNVQGAADMGVQPHQGAGYMDVTKPESHDYYKLHYGVDVPKEIGLKIPEMFDAAIEGSLKALWIMGEDVVQTDPNTQHVTKAMEALDLLVVQELFMSETAKLAHVVLPGASFLEKEGTFTNGERRIQKVNQAVAPRPGTKADGQIIVDIMNEMGFEQKGYGAKVLLEEISQVIPFFAGVTWENLGTQGLQWPVAPGGTGTDMLHTETFKRGKGKFHYFDWVETTELTENQEDYPYILTTGRILEHYNCGTMTRRTANKDIVMEDILTINPVNAREKGITDNDKVRIYSPRGEAILKASVSEDVKPGIVFTTFHFPEIMVNNITGNVHDEESMCPEYKVVAVDFEKAK
jgi:formate dehydrogenase major subunit